MKNFTVTQTCQLKEFLSKSLQISGSKAKQLLDQKKVFVNKQRVWIAGYKLTSGTVVEIQEDTPAAKPAPKYTIAAEDNDYLIVNKAAAIYFPESTYIH